MIPRLALLLVYLTHFIFSTTLTSSRYECGPHGKFEYCLDDFNDCVVGCHCYPGYYFDTTTKICEPSTKLFKESRRFNNKFNVDSVDADFEVRNVRPIQVTSPPTTDVIDNKVNSLSKNADELSDWLYNQFFKDIETQVINKTDTIKQTRKDGTGSTWKGVKNKKKSSKKKNSKKKKHKRDSLRRQLLRIAEDDSIFESADADDEEKDDDDDDEDSGSEDDSDEESENDKSGIVKLKYRDRVRFIQHGDGSDKDHNHKEILMLKSEPKPTLPSFILLPNIDSPFGMYPLALPPAPPIQMFPMAPLPPMMAPPGLPFCDEVTPVSTTLPPTTLPSTTLPPTTSGPSSTTTETDSKETSSPEAETTTDITTTPTPDAEIASETTPTTEKSETDPETRLRFGGKRGRLAGRFLANREEEKRRQDLIDNGDKNGRKEILRQKPRQNFMEQLKDKRKKIRNMQSKLKQTDEKLQLVNNNYGPQISPIVPQIEKPKENRDLLDDMVFLADEPYSMFAEKPTTEPIGFKYLSELIHRPENKLNNHPIQPLFTPSRPLPQIPINENQQPYVAPLDVLSRRAPPVAQSSQANKFLIELGRQIASLIRKFEIKDLQATKEIEQLRNASIPQPSVFSENIANYGSRSYWERSVRSPTPTSQSIDDELDDKYLNSNERLLQLENKVHVAAKKLSLLELEQLERIANIMEMKKNMELYGKDNETESEPSNSSLNVSLLPRVIETQSEHPKTVLHTTIQVIDNVITNKTQLTNTNNITYTKSKIILKQNLNLFTPNTHPAKQPYKHTWNIDGIGLSEAFPRLAVQEKNASSEKIVTSDMIHNYLANVFRKRFGSWQTYYNAYLTTSKRPLIKPIVQMHSPLKHTYRPPYHHSFTLKPPLLNMETELNKPLKKDIVEKCTTQNIKSLFKTSIPIQFDRSPIEQKSYFHHDFHELDYYDRK